MGGNVPQTQLETNVNLLVSGSKLVFYMNGKRIEITRYERWIEDLKKEIHSLGKRKESEELNNMRN